MPDLTGHPQHYSTQIKVRGHRFGLAERELPALDDFAATGLVAGTDGGAVIHTGIADGWLHVQLVVLAEPPAGVEDGWEEAAEVSWRALEGRAALDARGRAATPPSPGDYRLRVYARGRDEGDVFYEHYRLVVWPAPAAAPVVLRRTDRLGHRLRGEPEPVRPARPEHAYRWLRRTVIAEGGTVTVVTGASPADVLRAFGADPDRPEPVAEFGADGRILGVLDAGGAVVVVEPMGFAGSHDEVLLAASTSGRAASMYWNINGHTRLAFAERGRIVPHDELPEVLDGLDFTDYLELPGKGLVAVGRFTGRGLAPEDLEQLHAGGIGYRVP
ncbi:DUF6461 domain-containing protein [Dactylosporangium sp. CS-033363]|uniref:DUF6461 domain-containing protein n=1 Tax=Dactylosporangium sp. CS-033363 TaxID=3239935 RepID=UPI003D936D7D